MIESPQPELVIIKELNQTVLDLDLYLSWLRNVQENRFIEAVRKNYSKSDLQQYLETRVNNSQVKFWGIFLAPEKFIGTIKLEPIDWSSRTAWLGMMIGEPSERGKGYGSRALRLVLNYAERSLLLKEIFLGVHKENRAALKIYKKCGFEIHEVSDLRITMKRELKTPSGL